MTGTQSVVDDDNDDKSISDVREDLEDQYFDRGRANGFSSTRKDHGDNDTYEKSKSIVLIGMRGVGKSTLGLLASAALKFKLENLETSVAESTGGSNSLSLGAMSIPELRKLEYGLIVDSLTKNSRNHIIVLPATCVDYEPTVKFLSDYAVSHPIIHIECEEWRILSYVGYDGPLEKGVEWISRKRRGYQGCSNFDFFNLKSESNTIFSPSFPKYSSGLDVLTLKAAENGFLNFLSFIIWGRATPEGYLKPPEETLHSSVVQIRFPEVLNNELMILDMALGSDAIEVVVVVEELIIYDVPLRRLDEFIAKVYQITSFSFPLVLSVEHGLHVQTGLSQVELTQLYFDVLLSGIRLGMNYVSINLMLGQDTNFLPGKTGLKILENLSRQSHNTKIIGTYHLESTEDFWNSSMPLEIISFAVRLGCDIVKITKKSSGLLDNLSSQQIRGFKDLEHHQTKIVTYNTTDLGRLSKILNPHFTSTDPIYRVDDKARDIFENNTFTSLYGAKMTSLGFTAVDLNKALCYSFIAPKVTFYVVGASVNKSLSPSIHNVAYKALGLHHECDIFQCFNLDDIKNLMMRHDFGGACVLMPFKQEALKLVTESSEHVRRIGALNTLVAIRSADNFQQVLKVRGENTDWLGIKSVISASTSPINSVNESKIALVIGAGGMSRASLYALISLGISKIYLYNRTKERAVHLAEHFNRQSPLKFEEPFPRLVHFDIKVLDNLDSVPNDLLTDSFPPTVVIKCIPGKDLNSGELIQFDIPEFWFSSASGGVYVETGYDPLIPPTMLKVRKYSSKGWVIATGLDYLHAQAIAQFEMHTGKIAPRPLMKKALVNSYAALK